MECNFAIYIHLWKIQSNHGCLGMIREGSEGGERKKKARRAAGRRGLAGKQGFQDNGKLMQEINVSYNGHVDYQRQGPAHWKSELLKYMISILFHAHFHATPFGGGHLSSH